MRRLLLILLLVCPEILLGQIVIIKDSLLNTPIENASLIFKKSGTVSNGDGIVDISIFNNHDIIEISHLSYNSKKVVKKKIISTIYLTQKTNMLPDIILSEEIKIPISEKYPTFKITPIGISLLQISTANILSRES
jgi:hypothetical protein